MATIARNVKMLLGVRDVTYCFKPITKDNIGDSTVSKKQSNVAPPDIINRPAAPSSPPSRNTVQSVGEKIMYVTTFVFTSDLTRVLLVRKNRPAWQAGKVNGIGGKLRPLEYPAFAASRKLCEESGVYVEPRELTEFVDMFAPTWENYCYYYVWPHDEIPYISDKTDEKIELRDVADLMYSASSNFDDYQVANLGILILSALYKIAHPELGIIQMFYHE